MDMMQQGDPQQGAQQQAPAAGAPQGGESENDPVNRIFIAAMKVIHTPAVTQQLLAILRAGQADPARALARAATLVMKGLFDKSRGTMPPESIMPALQKIVAEIAVLAQTAKLFTVDDDLIEEAMQAIVQQIQAHAKTQGAPGQATAAAAPPGLVNGQQPAAAGSANSESTGG